ncbi:MAG: hypothetical protein ACWGQW_03310 [bacterium]
MAFSEIIAWKPPGEIYTGTSYLMDLGGEGIDNIVQFIYLTKDGVPRLDKPELLARLMRSPMYFVPWDENETPPEPIQKIQAVWQKEGPPQLPRRDLEEERQKADPYRATNQDPEKDPMPLPTPNQGESQKEFIGRCVGILSSKGEFNDPSQRAAVCYSQYRRSKGPKAQTRKGVLQSNDPELMRKYDSVIQSVKAIWGDIDSD